MTGTTANAPELVAGEAAAAAGVVVRELADVADLAVVCELFQAIWRTAPGSPLVTVELLKAMVTAGNHVAGAFDGDRLLGGCLAFFGDPAEGGLHSHIAGVARAGHGRGVGFALKLHQRAWALRRGVTRVSWTFDPLVRRNAHFNLTKLAARPASYLTNFYGPMGDAINGSGDTDRLMVGWDLASPPVDAAVRGLPPRVDGTAGAPALSIDADGRPARGPADAAVVLVAVPADIEAVRANDPGLGRAWRIALREVLHGLMADGARVVGFDRAGHYVVSRERS
ncbi:GNAT family N-acetyltransferase [Amycolatopsis sp., V23-08]|uniref:GNAT family N-acetyltransferase n=1 Tax=Amycolatopsis heterodermiae TaxID=3110235 RepID=A0ABU5R280_9PSEU|nr:GNAT family N-acetyltransferase [Amycolatopsis sp., V23-08]MEA5360273.1 GNAT family N-acetyltransferase [Amycolatopsis sp., V23-08]